MDAQNQNRLKIELTHKELQVRAILFVVWDQNNFLRNK